MTRLTTVFGRSRRQNFFLTFSVFKASLLSREHVSVCIAHGGDLQSTEDYPMLLHIVMRRKRVVRANLFEIREGCSGMCSGARNLSTGLKKSLVFSHPEYGHPDIHSCEGAGAATSGSFCAQAFLRTPNEWRESRAFLCRLCLIKKTASITPRFSTRENEGHQYPILCVHFSRAVSDCPSSPSSVARYVAAGLGVRHVGLSKTSSHTQEILAVRPSVSSFYLPFRSALFQCLF